MKAQVVATCLFLAGFLICDNTRPDRVVSPCFYEIFSHIVSLAGREWTNQGIFFFVRRPAMYDFRSWSHHRLVSIILSSFSSKLASFSFSRTGYSSWIFFVSSCLLLRNSCCRYHSQPILVAIILVVAVTSPTIHQLDQPTLDTEFSSQRCLI